MKNYNMILIEKQQKYWHFHLETSELYQYLTDEEYYRLIKVA